VEALKLGKNDPCPCKSGKKFRQCCWPNRFQWLQDPPPVPAAPAEAKTTVIHHPSPYPRGATFWSHPPGQPDAAPPEGGEWTEWYFVKDKGWTHKRDLKPGDQIRQKGGGWETVPEDVNIQVTEEHPFFVQGRGWTPLRDIRPGELIRTDDGWVAVKSIESTGRVETVYNLEVEDDHTYFVGKPEWGFSVWAHNACSLTEHRLQAEGSTLLVGEGDFSFAVALARRGKLDPKRHQLVATDLTEGGYRGNLPEEVAARREHNIQVLKEQGFTVHENVNALKLGDHFAPGSFDNIVWMGPWPAKAAGKGSAGAQARSITALRDDLVIPFLRQAEPLLKPQGRVFLAWQQTKTSLGGRPRDTGLHANLALQEVFESGGSFHGTLKLGGQAEFVPAIDYPGFTPISNWNKGSAFSPTEKWRMYAIQRADDMSPVFLESPR
jgi:hypothetical protein